VVASSEDIARQGKANFFHVLILYKENPFVGDNVLKKQINRAVKVSTKYVKQQRQQLLICMTSVSPYPHPPLHHPASFFAGLIYKLVMHPC
jgi:hypothetical protein